MKSNSYFITVEGIEGAGKTTAIQFICHLLRDHQIPYVLTREPGGTVIGDAIRQVLLANNFRETMDSHAELLLMFASRAQNLAQVIKPTLQANQWVLSDRFSDASYAYQGGGRGVSLQKIAALEQMVHADLQPDITLLLDIPVELGITRIQQRARKDRIEQEQHGFFERVRRAYLERAAQYPKRFKIIDARGDIASVEAQLSQILLPLIPQKTAL